MKKKEILFLLILLLVFFAIYWKSTGYDFIYDSKNLFAHNPVYTGNYPLSAAFKFGFLEKVGLSLDRGTYYRPLSTLSFLIEKEIWGLNPRNLRIINFTLFGLTLILLFYFFKIQIFKLPVPQMLTALFALHPLQVDNLVWIVGRSDLLLLLWGVLTLLFLELYCQKNRYLFIILGLLCYGLGIFSKESMIFLLPVLLIYEKIRTKRISPQFHLAILMISVCFFVVKFLVVGMFPLPSLFGQDQIHYSISTLATLGYYFKSILLPYNCPSFLPPSSTITAEHIFMGLLFLLLLVLLLVMGKKKIYLLIPLTLIFLFIVGHLILLFTPLYPFRASSRYLIFPLLGVFWLGGYMISKLASFWRYFVFVVLLVSFVPFVFIKQSRYTNEISFWEQLHDEFPAQGYFTVKTAESLSNQKKYLQAESVLTNMQGKRMDLPTAIDTSLLWARIEFVKARYPISEKWLKRMNKFSLYPEAVLRKGIRKAMILISTGETDNAERELKFLIDKFNFRELMVMLFELYLGKENWSEAAELENEMKKRFTGVPLMSTAETRHQFEGSSQIEKFRFYIAYKNYRRAIDVLQIFPKDVKRELLLAKILYWNGQEEKAKSVVDSILESHSRDYSILNQVGYFYLQEMFRLNEGLIYLNQSLKIKPYQPEIIQLVDFLNTRYKTLRSFHY